MQTLTTQHNNTATAMPWPRPRPSHGRRKCPRSSSSSFSLHLHHLSLLFLMLLLLSTTTMVLGSAAAAEEPTSPLPLSQAHRLLLEAHDRACEEMNDCASCFKRPGCGWCGQTGHCVGQPESCEKGWSDTVCQASCPAESPPMHEAGGVISVGSQTPRSVYYLPEQTCTYTIWPFPEGAGASGTGGGGSARRTMVIRLQFEYVDLGPDDSLDIYSNGLDGAKILTIVGTGQGVVNRIITSRSFSVVIRLNAVGPKGGTGFRLYYRVIESSPLDIYLISAIIVTSILTCILCSCCCNSCVSMITGHPIRGRGGAGGGVASGGNATRALSAEEKARLPLAPYDPADATLFDFKECCICLSEFETTDMIRKLPCGHFFHSECVDGWFSVNSLCPLCKLDVKEKIDQMPLSEEEMAARSNRGLRGRLVALRRGVVSVWRGRGAGLAAAAAAGGGNMNANEGMANNNNNNNNNNEETSARSRALGLLMTWGVAGGRGWGSGFGRALSVDALNNNTNNNNQQDGEDRAGGEHVMIFHQPSTPSSIAIPPPMSLYVQDEPVSRGGGGGRGEMELAALEGGGREVQGEENVLHRAQ